MPAVAYESRSGQPLPQVFEEGHSRLSPVLCDARFSINNCRWLTVVFILSTRLKNCNAVTIYVTNLIPKLVEDAIYTSLMPDGFIVQQDGTPAHRSCNARMVTRRCNDFIAKHAWMATKLARS